MKWGERDNKKQNSVNIEIKQESLIGRKQWIIGGSNLGNKNGSKKNVLDKK